MKKITFMFFAAVICISFLSVSFAKDMGEKKLDEKDKNYPAPQANKRMFVREIIATQDGGLVLMKGNKLIKYDASLNVVKEVEIEMDKSSYIEDKK